MAAFPEGSVTMLHICFALKMQFFDKSLAIELLGLLISSILHFKTKQRSIMLTAADESLTHYIPILHITTALHSGQNAHFLTHKK